ncbi:MAG: phytanoyl-CoA dioxygenase family protein, partial [Pseudomonadota bacterium]
MLPEEILKTPARVLTQAQREKYFTDGFVSVEEIVPADVLAELQRVTDEFQDKSRAVSASDDTYDIGPGHNKDNPVLRRLKSPDIQHDAYWNFSTGLMADVAADLVGPNVVFHHS